MATVSCCQGYASCCKPIEDWLQNFSSSPSGIVLCKHQSSGIFGAIRENDTDLFQFYLNSLTHEQLVQCCFHETCFGDTLLIFAASLGRTQIAKSLLNSLVDICQLNSDGTELLLSDFVNYESKRGKIALIEAIRCKHLDMVNLLLSFHADTKTSSRLHKKSALDWARTSGDHFGLVDRINEHHQINDHVNDLFTAISKHDFDAVCRLTKGGSPYEWNQEDKLCKELEKRLHDISFAKQRLLELDSELSRVDESVKSLLIEINNREEHIERLRSEQREITSNRVTQTMQALAKVRLSATPSNIRALLSIGKPTVDELLVAKGLCILLHVGKQQHGNRTESITSIEEADDRYWQQLKSIFQEKDSFYSRLHHYFFHKETVSLAAKATVQGASMTCSECVKSNGDTGNTSSLLLHSIKDWMGVVLASAVGHKQEEVLVQLESTERSILERNKVDEEVLTSSRSILRKEIDETNSDIAFDTEVVAQINRKLHLSKCMKYITSGGHTVLSWAMSNGDESILKQVLKTGAHTGIGEEVIVLCAVIIQMGYRRHLMRKAFVKLHPERISRERRFEHRSQCMVIAMRISSLHRIVKRRFGDIHLPLAQALFNGHSSLVKIVREYKREHDLALFQAINLAPMFRVPGSCIPRISSDALPWKDSNLMSLVHPCVQFQHEADPKSCTFVTSLRCTIELIDEHLILQRRALEAKIVARRESLLHKHRQKLRTELKSAMRAGNFVDMIRISNDGVSLDYEDDFGWTPLMLASVRDESLEHKQDLRLNGKPVSAVAFLLDRITPYKPTLSFESRLGLTALSVACTHNRLQAVSELLARGSPINQQSVLTGKSALMLGCEVGKIDTIKLLVKHGADVNLRDHSMMNAIELAIQNRHYEVSDYLQQLRVT